MVDFGTHGLDSVDYPDFVHPAQVLETRWNWKLFQGRDKISANKHQGIRCALAWMQIAEFSRQHNNCNMGCNVARFIAKELARNHREISHHRFRRRKTSNRVIKSFVK